MVERAFRKFGKFLVRARYFILLFWIVLAVVLVVTAPSLSKVGTTDESSFLPAGTPSTQVSNLLAAKFPSQEDTKGIGVIVFCRSDGLQQQDKEYVQVVDAWLMSDQRPETVTGVTSIFTAPNMEAVLASTDGTTLLSQVSFNQVAFATATQDDVVKLRDFLGVDRPAGLQTYVTGEPGISKDLNVTIKQSVDRTTIATIILVILLLLIIYRSPVAPLVPLITIGVAYMISAGILGFLAQGGWKISTAITSFLVVLVFGAGTDYCLFMISRFREELAAREDQRFEGGSKEAVIATASSISTVIAASASTVIIGFLGLLVASFGMIRSMGPSLAIAIGVTLLAGLTLTPALMAILGDKLFWPFHARVYRKHAEKRLSWDKLSTYVTRHAKIVAPVIIVLLLLPCLALLKTKQSVDMLGEMPKTNESVQGFNTMKQHFDNGELFPVDLVLTSKGGANLTQELQASYLLASTLSTREGVARVISVVDPQGSFENSPYNAAFMMSTFGKQASDMAAGMNNPGGLDAVSSQMSQVGTAAAYLQNVGQVCPAIQTNAAYGEVCQMLASLDAAGQSGAVMEPAVLRSSLEKMAGAFNELARYLQGENVYLYPDALASQSSDLQKLEAAFVSPDKTTIRSYVILETDPYAAASFATVRSLRTEVAALLASNGMDSLDAMVGGTTAKYADIQTSINHDLGIVMILVTLGILLVFMLLLGSVIAPLYLIGTVLISFGATLGLVTLIFQNGLGQSGILYMIPIILFVLLIALGADYNIFLSSRIREETVKLGMRDGIQVASSKTGGIITACGIILAGTFATLLFAPMQMLAQVGVAVAIGVLLDTFIVRALLVPALATLVGRWNWWPSKLSKQ